MEALLQLQPRCANLLLHCGAHAVDREITGATPTPEPTATWTPLPHMALIEEVEGVLKSNGLSVVNQAHSLTHDGLRYFGAHGDSKRCDTPGLRVGARIKELA